MIDFDFLHQFLGMVMQTETSIFIHQKKYASSLLNKFGLQNCKPVSIPFVRSDKLRKEDGSGHANESQYRKIVGSLLYLIATRPDIMFAASLLVSFMHCLSNKHFETAKRVLRYIQETLDFGLEYLKGKNAMLVGYCDNGGHEKHKWIYVYIGSVVFSWDSIKQNCVAL